MHKSPGKNPQKISQILNNSPSTRYVTIPPVLAVQPFQQYHHQIELNFRRNNPQWSTTCTMSTIFSPIFSLCQEQWPNYSAGMAPSLITIGNVSILSQFRAQLSKIVAAPKTTGRTDARCGCIRRLPGRPTLTERTKRSSTKETKQKVVGKASSVVMGAQQVQY